MERTRRTIRQKLRLALITASILTLLAPFSGVPTMSVSAGGVSCYQGDYGTGWDRWKYKYSAVGVHPYYYVYHDHYDYYGARGPLHTDETRCVGGNPA